jgi:hypothetical protein
MISAASQLQALTAIIKAVASQAAGTSAGGPSAEGGAGDGSLESPTIAAPLHELPGNQFSVHIPGTLNKKSRDTTWKPKNTIAKDTLKEIRHPRHML